MCTLEVNEKKVCKDCIGDNILSQEINKSGLKRQCCYCRKTGKTWPMGRLSARVDPIYKKVVHPGEDEPYIEDDSDNVSYRQLGDSPEEILTEMLSCDENIANDLIKILAKQDEWSVHDGAPDYYDTSSCYVTNIPTSGIHLESWEAFCESIKSDSRFFNKNAVIRLNNIFQPCLASAKSEAEVFLGSSGCRIKRLYRARVAHTPEQVATILSDPASQLGAPPSEMRLSGRMNAAGIPVMYMAFDPKVALAEVRPPIGSSVVVGSFKPYRPLRLLDVTKLSSRGFGSYFRLDLEEAAGFPEFLKHFSRIISRPVLPGQEQLEYLPTQCIAEYLCNIIEPRFDGLMFDSALNKGGKNVVIFAHAVKIGVDENRFPVSAENVELYTSHPDEIPNYQIELDQDALLDTEKEAIDVAFEIIIREIEVHEVLGLDYQTLPLGVNVTERPNLSDDF